MNNLFKGMIFVFININITLGNSKIDILPDFIGFFMIAKGLEELYNQSDNFIKIKPFATGLGVYTLIIFLLNLFGVTIGLEYIAGIVYTILLIYVSYTIIIGIMDIEKSFNTSLETERLMSSWKIMTIFNILIFIVVFIPFFNFIFLIFSIVFIIAYLVSFNRTKNLYYENNLNI